MIKVTIFVLALLLNSTVSSGASDVAKFCSQVPDGYFQTGPCNIGWAIVAADVISSANCIQNGPGVGFTSMALSKYSPKNLVDYCTECATVEGQPCRGGDTLTALYHTALYGIAREEDFKRDFSLDGKAIDWKNVTGFKAVPVDVCYNKFKKAECKQGTNTDKVPCEYPENPVLDNKCPKNADLKISEKLRFKTVKRLDSDQLTDIFKQSVPAEGATAKQFAHTMQIDKVEADKLEEQLDTKACFSKLEVFFDMLQATEAFTPTYGYSSASLGVYPVRILNVETGAKLGGDAKDTAVYVQVRVPLSQPDVGFKKQNVFFFPFEKTSPKRFPEFYSNIYCVSLGEAEIGKK